MTENQRNISTGFILGGLVVLLIFLLFFPREIVEVPVPVPVPADTVFVEVPVPVPVFGITDTVFVEVWPDTLNAFCDYAPLVLQSYANQAEKCHDQRDTW